MSVLVLVAACSNPSVPDPATEQLCTNVGCASGLTFKYAVPMHGSYALTIAAGAWSETFTCPAPSYSMLTLDGAYYPYQCDASSLSLSFPASDSSGPAVEGVPGFPAGSNAGAVTIVYDVTMMGSGGTVVVPQTMVVATSGAPFQPNGPACGPTCYEFEGALR